MQWIVHNIEDLMKKTGYVDKQNAEKYKQNEYYNYIRAE